MITTIDHLALSVANLEKSLTFYRDIIGFKVLRIKDAVITFPAALKKAGILLEADIQPT
jgi:catechol 2,3-dioxygenase-like lactoylglutathione lyase family enzyme